MRKLMGFTGFDSTKVWQNKGMAIQICRYSEELMWRLLTWSV
jgi:hypothetical protein